MMVMQESDKQVLRQRIASSEAIMIGLDFDGTLTPIQSRPESCWLTPSQRDRLVSLSRQCGFKVGVISGRSLADVRMRVGVPGIAYAGNHGIEIQDSEHHFTEPQAQQLRLSMPTLIQGLTATLQSVEGCWLEDKGHTVSIHYREVHDADVTGLVETTRAALSRWPDFQMRNGKKVLEIRPRVNWNKSHAVRWIMERAFPEPRKVLLIYCGDDETDEDVFRAWPEQTMIRVGHGHPTHANARLEGPGDVWELLSMIEQAGSTLH